jgi:hypothetical protein
MDPNKEINPIENQNVPTGQDTYSHSQVNMPGDSLPVTPLTNPVIPTTTPLVSALPVATPLPTGTRLVDAKLFHTKYLFLIFGGYAIYAVIAVATPDAIWSILSKLIFFLFLAYVAKSVTELKTRPNDALTENDKAKMILMMMLDPLVGQAMYYYRLKKTKPLMAKIALKVGWKIFLFTIIELFIIVGVFVSQTWTAQHEPAYKNGLQSLSSDFSGLQQAAKSNDATAIKSSCSKIGDDVDVMKKIPDYPDAAIQTKIKSGLDSLKSSSNDCIDGVDQNDANLVKKSATELTAGVNSLKDAQSGFNGK